MDAPVCYAHLPQPVMPRVAAQKLLLGQKALVTGASSGIGRAIALSLGDAGADVVINYVSGEDKAEALAEEIRGKGSRALALRADVSDESQVRAMFGSMLKELGTIDLLVNNAGLQQDAPFHELTLAQWNKVIGVNLTGQFLCSREAVREFRRRGVQRADEAHSVQAHRRARRDRPGHGMVGLGLRRLCARYQSVRGRGHDLVP